MIAFDDGHSHLAHDIEAFLGIGVVADDIAQTGDMGAVLVFDVGQNRIERLQIGVYVGDNRVLHSIHFQQSKLPRNLETAKFVLRVFPSHVFACNQTSETRLTNGLLEPLEFVLQSFSNKFDAAIG